MAGLIVVLLLALLIPRACQALSGSKEDTGSREERGTGAPETATGTGTKGAGEPATKDASPNRGAPFVVKKEEAKKEEAGGEEIAGEAGGAATNLTAMVVGPAAMGGGEAAAVEDVAGSSSTDQTAPIPAGPSLVAKLRASRQPAAEPQNTQETSRAPVERPPANAEHAPARPLVHPTAVEGQRPLSNVERAPANRLVPSIHRRIPSVSRHVPSRIMATPVAAVPAGPINDRSDRIANVPVAVEPVRVAPPAPTAFGAGNVPTVDGTGGVATGFGGNAVGRPVNDVAPFNEVDAVRSTPVPPTTAIAAPGVLPGGPRRIVAAPVRPPRPTVF